MNGYSWFDVGDATDEPDEQGHYCGIFTRRPRDIALLLGRTHAPVQYRSTPFPLFDNSHSVSDTSTSDSMQTDSDASSHSSDGY